MRLPVIVGATVLLLLSSGCYETPRTLPTAPSPLGGGGLVQTTALQGAVAAGTVGGGVLTPGTVFPPTAGSTATLVRQESCLDYTIDTTGLPPGAYTNWVFVYNNPEACRNPARGAVCFGGPDLIGNPATQGSAFWGTGGVVGQDGVGHFASRTCVGRVRYPRNAARHRAGGP